jgi:hypothetical protein
MDTSGFGGREAIERAMRTMPESVVETTVEPVAAHAAPWSPVPTEPDAPLDVLKLAKQRLKVVKSELKRMAKLQTELEQLTRLINAAEGKPLAVVRDLPRRVSGS